MLENIIRLSKMREINKDYGLDFGEHFKMESLRTTVACLACVFVISIMLVVLSISSHTNIPAFQVSDCDPAPCEIASRHPNQPIADQVPTPAPSRTDTPSKADVSSYVPEIGQTVYVQVKTDHADIEVGWASSD
jgi:hypothetical protein